MAMSGESVGNSRGECDGKVSGKIKRKVGLLYDERMCKHDTPDGEDHPECPNRIKVIWEKLQLTGLAKRCVVLGGSKAEDNYLQLVHTKDHVKKIKRISTKQKDSRRNKIASQFDSIYLNGGSSEAAYLAAGSVVEVAEKVAKGELDCGFAIVRPPGHHAEENKPMGFCLFNNVAVAASYLLNERPDLGVKKILIVDWDVHHGNGTQKMFWEDPRVLVFSVHRHDFGSFYPTGDDGDYDKVGEGRGEGFNINVPWEQGRCRDADYLAVWKHILIPVTKKFDPDIVLISAGFDAAKGDPLGGCFVTPYGYSVMLKKLMEFAQGKIVMALEGGYNINSVAKSSLACVQVLLEDKPIQGSSKEIPFESTYRVIQAVRKRLCAYWPSLADELPWKKEKTPTSVDAGIDARAPKKRSAAEKRKGVARLSSKKRRVVRDESSQEIEVVGERDDSGKEALGIWDEDEIANLKLLNEIKVEPTRFASKYLLTKMGIFDSVLCLFECMGIHPNFPLTSEYTYKQVTRQFLATLKVEYEVEKYDENDPSAIKPSQSEGKISFKIKEKSYSCSIEKLCQIFGFKNGSIHSKKPPKAHAKLWEYMTGEKEIKFGTARTSKIRNPSLRYTARLLALTFFARHDSSRVQLPELTLLSLATMDIPSINADENLGCRLLDHWLTFVKEAKKKLPKKGICFGGMITKLLRGLNVDLTWDYQMTKMVPIMDHLYMKKMEFFRQELEDPQGNLKYVYEFLAAPNTTRHCLLPIEGYHTLSEESMSFHIPENLLYNYRKGDKQEEEEDDEDYEDFENFMGEEFPSLKSLGIPHKLPPPITDEDKVYYKHLQHHNKVLKEHHLLLERMFGLMKKVIKKLVNKKKKTTQSNQIHLIHASS